MSQQLQARSTIGSIHEFHEVQTLRQELTDSRKKLQDYADTVVSLHGELRTLRDGICVSCKRKFVPANLVSPQATVNKAAAVISSPLINSSQTPAESTVSGFYWLRLLIAHVSGLILSILFTTTYIPSTPPIPSLDRNLTSTCNPPTTTNSSEAITPTNIPSVLRWSAERDETANTALELNVTLVRAFIHEGVVRSIRFSVDGKYLAAVVTPGGKSSSIFIYNVETGDTICDLAEHASQYSSIARPVVKCVRFSPNGRLLVVGDDEGYVTVWDIPNKRIRNKFKGHTFVRSVDFSPNGRLLVSASWDGTVCIWNMRDGSAKVFTDTTRLCYSARFSPNGQFVATGNYSGLIGIWDVRTGQLVRRWTGHISTVRDVAFTPDGRGLVSGCHSGVVKCWDVSPLVLQSEDPMATKILDCDGNTLHAVAVSPDAQWIASGLSNGRMKIWDAHSAMAQCTLIGHEGEISSVDFSPVGNHLALGSYDRHVTLWRYTRMI